MRPTRRDHWRRRLGHGTLFLLAFGLTVALVTRLASYPETGALKDKLLYFEAHKDDYDLVFVGSSRVYRGIIPPVFDDEVAALGLGLASFNFAVPGMEAHEASALVRRVLAMEPARLRWIGVELGDWDPVIERQNRFKRRGIFWHDGPETLSVLRSTWLLEAPVATRAELALSHALHFAARTLSLGRGRDAVRSLFAAPEVAPAVARWQGFEPYTEASYKYHPLRRRFLERLDEYRAAVSELTAADAAAGSRGTYNAAALEAQAAMIRRAGAEPVHLITPTPRATPELDRLHREGRLPALLAFNRPAAYPELFAVERRFDREHLTQAGAERFTRLLAARFVTEVAGWPEPRLVARMRPGPE